MAKRRMFAKTIIDSDAFLDMPMSAQLLYFHLSMRADDDGFVNKPKTVMRICGCKDDDIKLLIAKKFIIPFESGVVVIKHWKIHNYIRKDSYTETAYKDEKATLTLDENNAYRQITGGVSQLCDEPVTEPSRNRHETVTEPSRSCDEPVTGLSTQDRIGKDSIGEYYIYTPKSGENEPQTEPENPPEEAEPKPKTEYKEIVDYLNQRAGTAFRPSSRATQSHINARLAEGFKVEDFKVVIDKMTAEWIGTEMQQYLRPETLFGAKFEGYLNAKTKRTVKQQTQPEGKSLDDLNRLYQRMKNGGSRNEN